MEPDIIAWRTFEDGKLIEAMYVHNIITAIAQIFKPISPRRVEYYTFFDKDHSNGEVYIGRRDLKRLSEFERDLLTLSEEGFKKKYPKTELYEIQERASKGN